mmetsp:Transcript_42566/g.109488  ORF Transcript_42566/g.109488 Transcript_42566/m.109488 type:complete len:209 (-) Transcript_42566:834-1460(-)
MMVGSSSQMDSSEMGKQMKGTVGLHGRNQIRVANGLHAKRKIPKETQNGRSMRTQFLPDKLQERVEDQVQALIFAHGWSGQHLLRQGKHTRFFFSSCGFVSQVAWAKGNVGDIRKDMLQKLAMGGPTYPHPVLSQIGVVKRKTKVTLGTSVNQPRNLFETVSPSVLQPNLFLLFVSSLMRRKEKRKKKKKTKPKAHIKRKLTSDGRGA